MCRTSVPASAAPLSRSNPLRNRLTCYWRNEEGATSIEYGLIAAFIFLAIINVLQLVSVELQGTFTGVQAGLQMRP